MQTMVEPFELIEIDGKFFRPLITLVSYLEVESMLKEHMDEAALAQLVLNFNNEQLSRQLRELLCSRFEVDLIDSLSSDIREQNPFRSRSIVEVCCNSGDAGSKRIDVLLEDGSYVIRDQGCGITPYRLFRKKLVPNATTNDNIAESIGRFGIGFYTTLAHLRNKKDRVKVTTHSGKSEIPSLYYEFIYFNGQYLFHVSEPDHSDDIGTTLQVISSDIEADSYRDMLTKHLRFSSAPIYIGDECINAARPIKTLALNGAAVAIYENAPINDVVITVSGVTVEEIPLINLSNAMNVVISLDRSTQLTESREAIILNNSRTVRQLLDVITLTDQFSREDQLRFMNSLAPLYLSLQKRNYFYAKEFNVMRALLDKLESYPCKLFLPDEEPYRVYADEQRQLLHPALLRRDWAALLGGQVTQWHNKKDEDEEGVGSHRISRSYLAYMHKGSAQRDKTEDNIYRLPLALQCNKPIFHDNKRGFIFIDAQFVDNCIQSGQHDKLEILTGCMEQQYIGFWHWKNTAIKVSQPATEKNPVVKQYPLVQRIPFSSGIKAAINPDRSKALKATIYSYTYAGERYYLVESYSLDDIPILCNARMQPCHLSETALLYAKVCQLSAANIENVEVSLTKDDLLFVYSHTHQRYLLVDGLGQPVVNLTFGSVLDHLSGHFTRFIPSLDVISKSLFLVRIPADQVEIMMLGMDFQHRKSDHLSYKKVHLAFINKAGEVLQEYTPFDQAFAKFHENRCYVIREKSIDIIEFSEDKIIGIQEFPFDNIVELHHRLFFAPHEIVLRSIGNVVWLQVGQYALIKIADGQITFPIENSYGSDMLGLPVICYQQKSSKNICFIDENHPLQGAKLSVRDQHLWIVLLEKDGQNTKYAIDKTGQYYELPQNADEYTILSQSLAIRAAAGKEKVDIRSGNLFKIDKEHHCILKENCETFCSTEVEGFKVLDAETLLTHSGLAEHGNTLSKFVALHVALTAKQLQNPIVIANLDFLKSTDISEDAFADCLRFIDYPQEVFCELQEFMPFYEFAPSPAEAVKIVQVLRQAREICPEDVQSLMEAVALCFNVLPTNSGMQIAERLMALFNLFGSNAIATVKDALQKNKEFCQIAFFSGHLQKQVLLGQLTKDAGQYFEYLFYNKISFFSDAYQDIFALKADSRVSYAMDLLNLSLACHLFPKKSAVGIEALLARSVDLSATLDVELFQRKLHHSMYFHNDPKECQYITNYVRNHIMGKSKDAAKKIAFSVYRQGEDCILRMMDDAPIEIAMVLAMLSIDNSADVSSKYTSGLILKALPNSKLIKIKFGNGKQCHEVLLTPEFKTLATGQQVVVNAKIEWVQTSEPFTGFILDRISHKFGADFDAAIYHELIERIGRYLSLSQTELQLNGIPIKSKFEPLVSVKVADVGEVRLFKTGGDNLITCGGLPVKEMPRSYFEHIPLYFQRYFFNLDGVLIDFPLTLQLNRAGNDFAAVDQLEEHYLSIIKSLMCYLSVIRCYDLPAMFSLLPNDFISRLDYYVSKFEKRFPHLQGDVQDILRCGLPADYRAYQNLDLFIALVCYLPVKRYGGKTVNLIDLSRLVISGKITEGIPIPLFCSMMFNYQNEVKSETSSKSEFVQRSMKLFNNASYAGTGFRFSLFNIDYTRLPTWGVFTHLSQSLCKIVGKDIEIRYSTERPNAKAFVRNDEQFIYFNPCYWSSFAKVLVKLLKEDAPDINQFKQILNHMILTITHELTHIADGDGCLTHNDQFTTRQQTLMFYLLCNLDAEALFEQHKQDPLLQQIVKPKGQNDLIRLAHEVQESKVSGPTI